MGEDDVMSTTCFIGIDVSKDQLDTAIRPTKAKMRFANNDQGIDALIQQIQPLKPTLIVMEATGRYHQLLLARLLSWTCPLLPSIHARLETSHEPSGVWQKPIRLMPTSLPNSLKRFGLNFAPLLTMPLRNWRPSVLVAGRLWRCSPPKRIGFTPLLHRFVL